MVQGAEHAVREAERAEERSLARGRAVLAAARQSKELARFDGFLLTDGAIETPTGRAVLSARVRAFVEPGATLAAARQAALMRLAAQSGTRGGVLRDLGRRSERLYLLVETPELVSLAPCKSDEAEARRFAELVNVAALNAEDFARRRIEAVREAEAELERLEERRAAAVREAKAKLEQVAADTAAPEAERRELERVELDTGEVDRCRAELRRLEDSAAGE
jgi:hypothetical protein